LAESVSVFAENVSVYARSSLKSLNLNNVCPNNKKNKNKNKLPNKVKSNPLGPNHLGWGVIKYDGNSQLNLL
jgi:hypothetical protein